MTIFAFIALTLFLFGALVVLAYRHLERENRRRWSRYARRSLNQVKALEGRLDRRIAEIPVFVPKRDSVVELKSMDPRARMESRYEAHFAKKVEIGGETVQIPRAS